MNDNDGLPIENFIQALTSQLDRAQTAMALKARNMPLTFAVKDLTFDLRAQVEMKNSAVHIRPAGPAEPDASTIHFTLTTITRPMIEENTPQVDPEQQSLREVLGNDITEEEERRLEWAGIRSADDLQQAGVGGGEDALQRVTQLPVQRLRSALLRATAPRITRIEPERLQPSINPDGNAAHERPLLRIRGNNLLRNQEPVVRIGNRPIPVLRANDRELLVAPQFDQLSGALSVEVEPGNIAETTFDLSALSPATEATDTSIGVDAEALHTQDNVSDASVMAGVVNSSQDVGGNGSTHQAVSGGDE